MSTCEWRSGCDHPALEGKSYCEEHVWLVYQKGSALSKRKKDIRVANRVHELESLINDAVAELIDEGYYI
jgi:hypothetical protein